MVKVKSMPSMSTTSTELLSRENRKLKKSNTRSDRFDVLNVELPSWEFYDTFIGSVANQEAIKNQEISTTEENLKKYLKIIHTHHKNEIKAANRDPKSLLPEYLEKLIALQSRTGKFESLWDVSRVLGMPVDLPYRRKESYKEYEIAGAVAVAAIRQHNHLFDILVEYHDKAMPWVKTNELVYQAREHVNNFYGTVDYTSTQSNISLEGSISTVESSNKNSNSTTSVKNDAVISSTSFVSTIKPSESNHLLLGATTTNDFSVTADLQALTFQEQSDHNELDALGCSKLNGAESRPVSPSKANFSNLLSSLHQFSGAHSEETLNAQRDRVSMMENKVLDLCLKLEGLLYELVSCLQRCINAYNASELFMNRHKTFDELTCRLADGFPATPAYAEQWKKDGVPGVRPVIVDILCEVQSMAEERLTLSEMLTHQGRDWKKKNNIEMNRSRWVLNWHGHNVVLKVLHCLDFLRKCRELCSWYGPAYYFVANPLQLPFPMHRAFSGLGLEPWVKDLLETQPHDRRGLANLEKKGEWAFQQYLNDFRRRFQAMSKEWSFNWPELPYIRDEEPNYRICTAIMVLFIACGDSIEKSFVWERKFINATSSTRGQATYMVGQGNQRTDKRLKIPTMEERKPRVDLVSHFQDLLNKKRERERQAKAEAEALAAAKAKSMYTFILEEESEATEETGSAKEQQPTETDPTEYEDEDFLAILKMKRRHARQFKTAVDDTGGPIAANAAVTEQAKINPLSASAPFDYTKHKRMSVINTPDRRHSTMNAMSPTSPNSSAQQDAAGSKRGSVLMRNASSMSLTNRQASFMGSTSSRLAPIHESTNVNQSMMRQSISQPSWVSTNAPTNSQQQANPVGVAGAGSNSLHLPSTTTATSSTDDSRKFVASSPMRNRVTRSPSMLQRPISRQNTLLDRKQSHLISRKISQAVAVSIPPAQSEATNDVPTSSRPSSATGLMARNGSVLGQLTSAKSSTRLSTVVSPSRKASVQTSTVVKDGSLSINNGSTTIPQQQPENEVQGETFKDRTRSPSVLTPSGGRKTRSASKILDREELLREGAQSRRVSRLPTMKETTVTVAGGVVNAAGLTKRRPTVNNDKG